ncbi:hypothetical protein NECAME_07187 [Necator americanus]|uniref:Uncharacterized protein n=1 Tax=Necator americanus TaxID=51031 RepID=W2TQ88_NECAM|nr:hypothetical protein NECAME_07187 [Necator americanus]ETN83824.1 hypothetical protein NECAME_07187 [Necator americanus]
MTLFLTILGKIHHRLRLKLKVKTISTLNDCAVCNVMSMRINESKSTTLVCWRLVSESYLKKTHLARKD